jgi:hypothetical protein
MEMSSAMASWMLRGTLIFAYRFSSQALKGQAAMPEDIANQPFVIGHGSYPRQRCRGLVGSHGSQDRRQQQDGVYSEEDEVFHLSALIIGGAISYILRRSHSMQLAGGNHG